QAADVAAYLATLKEGAAATVALPADAKAAAEGAALIEKLHLAFWTEPLTKSRKHTDAGLLEHLQQPARHHADTIFPDVRLTRAEAAAIAASIRSRQPGRAPASAGGNATAGKAIVAASCNACHSPADAPAMVRTLEDIARADWTVKGCVAENRGRAPDLRLSSADKTALIAFRNADRDVGLQSLRRFVPAEYAATQIKALNCVQCHSGGGENKLPDIALAGEKFDRAWLEALLAGKHPTKSRAWLEARMPAFASRAANLSLGLAARHGVASSTPAPIANPALAALGAKLTGAEGYSCIACHDAGARKALQVFEGQGPNLQLAGERLRYDYFQRWMHWPQRIAPATIMPRYTKDRDKAVLDTQLDGNAEKQFEAMWQWMRGLKASP
ncbi:MAG TPA: hypothetical protein VM029_01135, partial [Opitutaceae bacterium]|nr:hypothetical protein [Opitutaceae bacterium]